MIGLAALALAIWVGLIARGFWICGERDDRAEVAAPAHWPAVVAVVPARDEADVIARTLASLAAQDYAGAFRVVMVDDNSADGTGAIARAVESARVAVLAGGPLPPGWTGKLWALHQGIAAAGEAEYLWLTDADIEHAPDTLTRLVGVAYARPDGAPRRLVSFMALLHCRTWAERALIPAFVYFFMLLYPFASVNRSRAAGGGGGLCAGPPRHAGDGGRGGGDAWRADRRLRAGGADQAAWADLAGADAAVPLGARLSRRGRDRGNDRAVGLCTIAF